MRDDHPIMPVRPQPVEPPPKRPLPPILARTVNLCVNCVVAPGRMAARIARSRHERHYHPRHRYGRHHLAADVGFIVAILALIGLNGYLFLARPNIFPSKVRLAWSTTPATVRSGEVITFTLALHHDGEVPLEDATVALRLPERFVVISVTPTTYDAVTHTVRIGSIAPGAASRIEVQGITDAPDGTTLRIEATFHGFRSEGPRGPEGRGAARVERVVAVGTAEVHGVAVAFALGPQGDGPAIMRVGQPVEIGASYSASAGSESAVVHARAFRILITGPLVPTSTVTATGAVVRRGEIRWPFRGVRPAGETTGEVFLLAPPATVERVAIPAGISTAYTITPELILTEDARGAPTARIVGPPLTLDVAGELRVSTSARYFTPEGDQVGRGPLPPRVGSTTKYWVTWDARGLLRDADRVVVRAALPTGVEWTGRVMSADGEEPTFDAATRTVTWVVGKLNRISGDRDGSRSVSFELTLTPRATQVGSFAALLGETTAEGFDDLGTALHATAPRVTTELPDDERAKGRGVVSQ